MPNSPTFLYVEDEPMSRLVMEVLLTRALGYEDVSIFEDSAHFMERVEALPFHPDVVFLDIHVQPYDGFAMLSMLRKHPAYQDTCVIALTASVMNEEVEMLKDAGFNGGIAKPIDQTTFPALLDRIVNGEEIWSII